METGIQAMVSMMQAVSMDQETAARKLAAKFDLPPHTAQETVKPYWVGQLSNDCSQFFPRLSARKRV